MANYESIYTTNMFHVTDEDRYQELCKGLCGESLEMFDKPMSQNQLVQFRLRSGWGIYYKDDEGNLVPCDMHKIDIDDILTAYDGNGRVIYDRTGGDGKRIAHGFGGYDSIDYCTNPGSNKPVYDFDTFLKELQKILPEDEAFTYMEVGHEKLKYAGGTAVVITRNDIKSISLSQFCEDTINELLGKPAPVEKTD